MLKTIFLQNPFRNIINFLIGKGIVMLGFLMSLSSIALSGPPASLISSNSDPNVILFYISNSWKTLQRSMTECQTLEDPKTHITSILYLPYGYHIPKNVIKLKQHCNLTIKKLPKKIERLGDIEGDKILPPGLLYLPNPYVVPGGMFNEMYGWDSYFIIRGLIEAKKLALAHGIVENFFFEIDHYGGILNGNRTYFLSRTQLPFFAPIIRAVFEADKAVNRANMAWLAKAYKYAIKDYNLWTTGEHLAGNTSLSRYYDFGSGPVPELDDSQKTYYSDVVRYFLLHPEISQPYLLHLDNNASQQPGFYNISLCSKVKNPKNELKKDYQVCKIVKNVGLSDEFYKGDRAMRESGFDTSFRFGPFSADTLEYAPVDLNSLLYKAEKDLEWMSYQLGKSKDAVKWRELARKRQEKINHYMWNSKRGMYFDYNFKTKHRSEYAYATTFYPLWAGLASPNQAKKVLSNLRLFEKPGGIVTSLRQTGVQWDYPYGWAPIQLISIEGLYQYGFHNDADRIAHKFLLMVMNNFNREKTIREKYDVVSASSETNVHFGYKLNMIGFGWTNGVFLVLLNKLPGELVKRSLGLIIHKNAHAAKPAKGH